MRIKIKELEKLKDQGLDSYDANDVPVAIIFENDAERIKVIKLLQSMEPKDGERWFVMSPKEYDKKLLMEFMEIETGILNIFQ